jgi:amino acid transporter
VSKKRRVPVHSAWFGAVGAFILVTPALLPGATGGVSYAAVTSIAVIGLYIAYVTPTFLRLRQGESFQRGPWHLGRWSYVVGWIAVVWVVIITILFMLPQVGPITFKTFNYAVVAVLVVIGFAGTYWLVSAKNWFTGPRVQGTPEELAAIERELEV